MICWLKSKRYPSAMSARWLRITTHPRNSNLVLRQYSIFISIFSDLWGWLRWTTGRRGARWLHLLCLRRPPYSWSNRSCRYSAPFEVGDTSSTPDWGWIPGNQQKLANYVYNSKHCVVNAFDYVVWIFQIDDSSSTILPHGLVRFRFLVGTLRPATGRRNKKTLWSSIINQRYGRKQGSE